MHVHRIATLTLTGIALAAAAAPAATARPARPKFTSFAACQHHAPYHATRSCRWPAGGSFQAAFVFRSHVGARPLRGCFRASGPPPFGGASGCVSFGRIASKVYPLRLAAPTRGNYSVVLSWRVPENGRYRQVAVSRLRITTA